MKSIYCFILAISISFSLKGQEFSFQMYFEDAAGNQDTIILGYDPEGTAVIDSIFGEENISTVPLSQGLDVRISNEMRFNPTDPTSKKIEAKKQIVGKNCFSQFDIIGIDILTDDWPVTASWDSTLFQDLCINYSVLTSVNPGGWWDTGSPSDLFGAIMSFQHTVTFSSQVDGVLNENYWYITAENDSVSMFWFTFGDSTLFSVSNDPLFQAEGMSVFPNPTSDKLVIELDDPSIKIEQARILDVNGKANSLLLEGNIISLAHLPEGVYVLYLLSQDGRYFLEKIVKAR